MPSGVPSSDIRLIVPLERFDTHTLSPSNATSPGSAPTSKVASNSPSVETLLTDPSRLLVTHISSPSNAIPLGPSPTCTVASISPSWALTLTMVLSWLLATHRLSPSHSSAMGRLPTSYCPTGMGASLPGGMEAGRVPPSSRILSGRATAVTVPSLEFEANMYPPAYIIAFGRLPGRKLATIL